MAGARTARRFALDLHAAVRTTRAALPALVTTRGAVVNISSDSARRPGPDPLPYSTAKAALNAFTRAVLLLASPTMPSAIGENWVVDAGATKIV